MDKIEIKVGQVWEDWDSRTRSAGIRRKLKVLEIVDGKALVQHPSGRGNKTRIRLDRFRPTATGYKLVSEDEVSASPVYQGTDDKVYGTKFVYCIQHCRVHETGWCTVAVVDKVALLSLTLKDAAQEWNLKKIWLLKEKA